VNTASDDGIRVWLDDRLVIDDWTWHAPKRQHADFDIEQGREVKLRIEYFELDGHAVLQVDIVPRP
jgi:alpha-L-fucosidase